IPARLNPIDSHPEFIDNGRWVYADLECGRASDGYKKGKLILTYDGQSLSDDPEYELRFTISKLDNGFPVRLNFSDKEGKEGSVTWKSTFASGILLEEGTYLLTTGTRLPDGNVLPNLTVFNVVSGWELKITLKFR
ncbi:MAG: hypothetical protein KBS57_02330, partial [Alistipes sp.]|nr:hypothetical protein [Candidatus Minthomonas equi]